MRKRTRTSIATVLGLFALLGLVAALTPSITSLNLAHAQSGAASLTALTVSPGSLDPAFSSTVISYTVALAHDVDQITIVATPAGAGSVAFAKPGLFGTTPIPDADTNTDGHQVDIPPLSIYVEVTELASQRPPTH